MVMKYDLHLHSCLSLCADNDMTPATIAGFAKLLEMDIIAITDHNSAKNLPYAKIACDEYGIKLLPGIEVTTSEEIHILCYFPTVELALAAGEELYASLPNFKYDTTFYGDQIVCDQHDIEVERIEKFLINATGFNIEDTVALALKYGGIAIPAHIDKDSYSILSVLGMMPQEVTFWAVEVKNIEKQKLLQKRGLLSSSTEVISNSDAHMLNQIATNSMSLDETSCLWPLIKTL